MSLSSDNFTALIHLRDQARKWKNITFVTILIAIIIVVKMSTSSQSDDSNISDDDDYIAKIEIDGIILNNEYRRKSIREISNKDNIKAVIVNINSPGGGIVGSEILYRELSKLSEKKPVVATLSSMATSGGYMAALGANHILAYNGTLTGSIGVILQSTEVTEMANKLGIKFNNYKSSILKGTPSPFEKSNKIVDRVINESVQDSYKFFVDMVLSKRKGKIVKRNIRKVIDGRVFTGRQALEIGLIDGIGGQDEALVYLREKHKIIDIKVKEISVNKTSNKLIDKIINKDSISNLFRSNSSNKEIMAIW